MQTSLSAFCSYGMIIIKTVYLTIIKKKLWKLLDLHSVENKASRLHGYLNWNQVLLMRKLTVMCQYGRVIHVGLKKKKK